MVYGDIRLFAGSIVRTLYKLKEATDWFCAVHYFADNNRFSNNVLPNLQKCFSIGVLIND